MEGAGSAGEQAWVFRVDRSINTGFSSCLRRAAGRHRNPGPGHFCCDSGKNWFNRVFLFQIFASSSRTDGATNAHAVLFNEHSRYRGFCHNEVSLNPMVALVRALHLSNSERAHHEGAAPHPAEPGLLNALEVTYNKAFAISWGQNVLGVAGTL